jgi:hypothetical protein
MRDANAGREGRHVMLIGSSSHQGGFECLKALLPLLPSDIQTLPDARSNPAISLGEGYCPVSAIR